ncbi:putative peptide zinc metalloprotease protein [Pseudonocardia ammonioxydans]|uniref:Putative peptide zinc metalloprotease protein n=1 Tax=Pseudonocardia ammonioxydans TaxID=260086 RepID=A0A1I4ZKS7_PSUAM|nr:hypothetical protein [Pseudonocardia ammonioxydans]SFN50663.1 putative peptide zinc metalloprotease protein [Pseudonocardia ammonioxydans]
MAGTATDTIDAEGTTSGTTATAGTTAAGQDAGAPVPAPGIEFLGPYQGSGFRTPRYLLRREDGQVAQLPWLLYRTAFHLDGRRGPDEVAELLHADTGRDITGDQVRYLIADRLRPAGLAGAVPDAGVADRPGGDRPDGDRPDAVRARPDPTETDRARPDRSGADRADADRSDPDRARTPPPGGRGTPARGDHLLMLRLRTALVPARVVWRIAGPLRPLFRAPVVVLVLLAFVTVDVAVAARGWDAVLGAGRALTTTPALTLAVLGLVVVAGVFHECGHVTACRYGGATPGAMGVGIYLVWPAFYSTVTDAYRLSRAGRLRTDLGGVYFNAIVLTVLGGLYLATGSEWLLAASLLWHVETAWQFLPSLRMDGYYILADLVGVPDLFNRIRPILRSLVRRRHSDPLVADLKPWARRVVTAWVVLVVPLLLGWLLVFVALAPQLAPAAWDALTGLAGQALDAARAGEPAGVLAAVLRGLLLLLPWVGGAYLVALLVRRMVRAVGRFVRRRRPQGRHRWRPGSGVLTVDTVGTTPAGARHRVRPAGGRPASG